MKYSLLQIYREHDDLIDGVWIQDHTGTQESAAVTARATELANSNRIRVAVVSFLYHASPNFSLKKGLRRLDKVVTPVYEQVQIHE